MNRNLNDVVYVRRWIHKLIFFTLSFFRLSLLCSTNTEFFCTLFSSVPTENGDLFCKSSYSLRIRRNADQKKIRNWTLSYSQSSERVSNQTVSTNFSDQNTLGDMPVFCRKWNWSIFFLKTKVTFLKTSSVFYLPNKKI